VSFFAPLSNFFPLLLQFAMIAILLNLAIFSIGPSGRVYGGGVEKGGDAVFYTALVTIKGTLQ
jgi:hypothetical protein